jgi:hypothetical protein
LKVGNHDSPQIGNSGESATYIGAA